MTPPPHTHTLAGPSGCHCAWIEAGRGQRQGACRPQPRVFLGPDPHLSSALAVTFRPDGAELAVATLNSQITFWDPENAVQTGSIEGRHDLKSGRKELDKITAKHSAKGK